MTGSFLDYGMPRADDFPPFVSELVEIPAKTNPLGIKGIGEAGTIAAPPTVVNAVLDALHRPWRRASRHAADAGAHLAGRKRAKRVGAKG